MEESAFPPRVEHGIGGWELAWADLALAGVVATAAAGAARLRAEVEARARASVTLERLAEHPTAAAVRRLFRAAGTDPTRWRPSSEALLRRVLKGEALPAIGPLVDINNCLSVELVVPACVMDVRAITPPFVLRAGAAGEGMLSMRGPIDLGGKPLLADAQGPFGTPITDSERVRVGAETRRVWLVAYLPAGVVTPACVERALARLTGEMPGVEVRATAATR